MTLAAGGPFWAGFGVFLALLAVLAGFVIRFAVKLGRRGPNPPRRDRRGGSRG